MQLVEYHLSGNAPEQGVTRMRHTRQEIHRRGDDGDQHAPEDTEADDAQHRNQR